MLHRVLQPFRTVSSASRVLLAALIMYVPLVGVIWVNGWLLDHQRTVAWEADGQTPSLELSGERLKTGLWAMVISWVWSLPVAFVLEGIGTLIVLARVVGPLTDALNAIVATPDPDPLLMQQQLNAVIVESMFPAIGVTILLAYTGVILVSPLIAAATARYNLYRAPREGFRFRPVLDTLARGRALTLQASALTIAAALVTVVFAILAWPLLVRSATAMGSVLDPTTMMTATRDYLLFALIVNASSLVALPIQVAAFTAWGVWARRVYNLDTPSQSGR